MTQVIGNYIDTLPKTSALDFGNPPAFTMIISGTKLGDDADEEYMIHVI